MMMMELVVVDLGLGGLVLLEAELVLLEAVLELVLVELVLVLWLVLVELVLVLWLKMVVEMVVEMVKKGSNRRYKPP